MKQLPILRSAGRGHDPYSQVRNVMFAFGVEG